MDNLEEKKSASPQKIKRGSTSLALKAGFWYVISNFLVKGLSFITTPIFSRLLSKEAYGEFTNFASWQSLLLIITSAEMQNTVARAYYDFEDDFDGYVSSVTITSCAVTLLFYAIFLIFGDWIFKLVSIPREYVHIMFFMLMCQAFKQIYFARERTLYRYKSVAAISVVNLLIPTIISVILVVLAQESQRLSARIYGFYLPSAIIGLGCAAVVLWRGKRFKWKHTKYAFVLSLPLMMHYLTAHLLSSSDTIVTKLMLGAEVVSIVSIATSTIHILTILLQSMSGAMTTWLMDNLNQDNIRATRKGTLIYVVGVSVAAIGVMLLAPEVVWVLGGTKYAQAAYLLPGMIVAVIIQTIASIFTTVLTYKKKVLGVAICTAVVACVSIAAKVFLLPRYGVEILPYINIVAFSVLFVCDYILMCRAGGGKAVSLKGFCVCIALLLLVMLACGYLYENTIIRYAIVLCMGIAILVVAYKNRKLIKTMLKKK